MNDLRLFQFNGSPVEWIDCPALDHGVGLPQRALAAMLGADARNFPRMLRDYGSQFLATETTVVKMTTVRGNTTDVRLFSPNGCLRVCRYVTTPKTNEVYNFMLAVAVPVMDGSARVVTEDQMIAASNVAYDRGLADGKTAALDARVAALEQKDAARTLEMEFYKKAATQAATHIHINVEHAARQMGTHRHAPELAAIAEDKNRRAIEAKHGKQPRQRSFLPDMDRPAMSVLEDRICDAIRAEAATPAALKRGGVRYSLRAITRLVRKPRRFVRSALAAMIVSQRVRIDESFNVSVAAPVVKVGSL